MKLNVFLIPMDNVDDLKAKIASVGMVSVYSARVDEWDCEFYFSEKPKPVKIPWVHEFSAELASLEATPQNTLYFGAFIWQSRDICFAFSFGKAHFYLKEYCDTEFGINMARRIGVKGDVRQKASRRYASRRKRDIRSYQRLTGLDIESGESIDFLQTGTSNTVQWGVSGRFGSSMLISPVIKHEEIPEFLRRTQATLALEPLFDLPRTEKVVDKASVQRYDAQLLQELLGEEVEFEQSSHQLVGVDFVFSGQEHYSFKYRRAESPKHPELVVADLRAFIRQASIRPDDIFRIKVKTIREDSTGHADDLKKVLDFSIEDEKVFLQNGQWVRFNEIYIDWLNRSVDEIEIDDTFDADLKEISTTEPVFNQAMLKRGYEVADKDFSIAKIRGHKIEAWDLKMGTTVYAVKFGTTKDLNYVCDQAVNLLEVFRNEPSLRQGIDIESYCLWLAFELKRTPDSLSSLGSIIFKQKLDEWARKCRDLGIKPQVRVSRKIKSSA